ncbi:MAG: hypothetical protein IKO40_01145 [Kiritimatiellae bacterium]|nr:hypothetical protein [Kiritimatiellia bacterium]
MESGSSAPSPFVVRSIEVTVGAGAPFVALFLADTHLTLCDARDDERSFRERAKTNK